jgi:hypothetical protein
MKPLGRNRPKWWTARTTQGWTKGNPNYSQRLSINGLVVDITDEPGALSRNCVK